MPYSVLPYQNGYKVCLTAKPTRCFSRWPLSRRTAERQRAAIERNERQHNGFSYQLEELGLSPDSYLATAWTRARDAGYDPSTLRLSDRPTYKLVFTDPTGRDHYFGATGYNDYIIYQHLEAIGQIPQGEADRKRNNYQARASEARGAWRKDRYSPNRLAMAINW